MSNPLWINSLGDHHVPPSTPRYVSLFHLGLIAIVALGIWGLMFELLPMD